LFLCLIIFYTAKNLNGKTVTGMLVAKDMRELSQILKDDGLVLIKADTKAKRGKFNLSFSIGVSATEKIVMTRNLSVMVATGLPTVTSFDILANQSKSKKLKNALLAVKEKINKGESIS
jgi:general secretion pathway protein F